MRQLTPGVLGRFARDRRAVSAVEFALVLPFLLVLYLGGIELSDAVGADRKVTLLARTVSDLVAQSSNLTSSDVSSIFAVSSGVMYPLALTDAKGNSILQIKVSEVWTNSKSISTVEWSKAQNTTADGGGEQITIPDAETNTGTVMATVTYTYTPVIAYGIVGTLTLTKTIYTRPRLSDCVELDSAPCGTATSYGS
jgi:Flp pilus assembly protein TadG